ncbi:MAG: hypothetical protein DRG11_02255 [Epsilonproteobacteria bacterium]|nr:MAG: hypothetical protein DRG11_02255 [Campylobacterota bacterium]
MIRVGILLGIIVLVIYLISTKIKYTAELVKTIIIFIGIVLCIYLVILMLQPTSDNYIKWTDTTRTE